eukprot:scaffold5646_cov36-Cyclotella_meneghiniana.AAC.2
MLAVRFGPLHLSTRFRNHFSIAHKTVSKGVSSGRASSAIEHYQQWLSFTDELGLDPFLEAFTDKVPFLQVFRQQIREGELALNKDLIRARSVEDYLWSVAQAFLAMGPEDPHLNTAGKTDFRISPMIVAWKKEDPPAHRVKPIPIQVIQRIAFIAQSLPEAAHILRATADMIIIAFFYLLRPGEYIDSPSDTTPFTFGDVQLVLGHHRLDLLTCLIALLKEACGGSLTFTTQRNGITNEHNAPPHSPVARVFTPTGVQHVTSSLITKTLRNAVKFLGHDLGFLPEPQAAGAMALLVSGIDTDIVQLLGRWQSDEMFRYLHLTAEPFTCDLASRMLRADYTMAPTQLVPCH